MARSASAVLVFAFVVVATLTIGSASIPAAETALLAAASRVIQDARTSVAQTYWTRARCVAVVTDLRRAAAGEHGKGIVSCRSGEQWTAPLFLQFTGGSAAVATGDAPVDILLLVLTDSGVQKLLQNRIRLGADASVAAGPIDRRRDGPPTAVVNSDVVAYARERSAFRGIELADATLSTDQDANNVVYGQGASAQTVLAMRDLSAPTEAHAFLAALTGVSPESSTPTPPAPTPQKPRTPARPPSVDSAPDRPPANEAAPPTDQVALRTRISEIQQTFDRLVASSARGAATGTTGTAPESGDTIAVDRATLLRLRQQIDAVASMLDRNR